MATRGREGRGFGYFWRAFAGGWGWFRLVVAVGLDRGFVGRNLAVFGADVGARWFGGPPLEMRKPPKTGVLLVDHTGIEPVTSSVSRKRASHCANGPYGAVTP